MPQPRKQDAIRRNKPQEIDRRAFLAQVPAPPDDLGEPVAGWWVAFAESELAAAYRPHMYPVLLRLFRLYDEIEGLELAKARLVESGQVFSEGSTGQTKMHPVFDEIRKLRDEALKLEREFGFTPKAVESLGLKVAQKTKAVEDVNRAIRDRRSGEAPMVVEV